MIAPNVLWKGDETGGLYVEASNLDGFSEISNNIFPEMPAGSQQAGDNYLYPEWGVVPAGFMPNAQWATLPQVHNEQYANPTLGKDVYDLTLNGVTAGALPSDFDPANWGQAVAEPSWAAAASGPAWRKQLDLLFGAIRAGIMTR